MNEQLELIARRIKELRDILDISPEEMAEKLGIPVETYADYEELRADIPIGVLYNIASFSISCRYYFKSEPVIYCTCKYSAFKGSIYNARSHEKALHHIAVLTECKSAFSTYSRACKSV